MGKGLTIGSDSICGRGMGNTALEEGGKEKGVSGGGCNWTGGRCTWEGWLIVLEGGFT